METWAEVECGLIIMLATARPTNAAAKAKCVFSLFILVSPFD